MQPPHKSTQSRLLLATAVLSGLTLLPALIPTASATILTFGTSPKVPVYTSMPQDYGDNVSAVSMLSATGTYQNVYEMGNGWTPNIRVGYSTEKAGEFPLYYGNDAEWPGGCFLWSWNFRTGRAIGDTTVDPAKAMRSGFEYYVTFTSSAVNRGILINSFVLDDYVDYVDTLSHVIQWRVAKGSPSGPVLASGSETFTNGLNVTVNTGMTAAQATSEPVFLVIKRMAGTEDDLALDTINFDEIGMITTSYNTGSLGTAGDGTNTAGVVLDQPGAMAAYGDYSTSYSDGQRTTVPFRSELNPPSGSPFTVEFWARPTASDGDDCPLFNRVSDGNRSGWAFFQRAAATGWNFRMYDGNGSNLGWSLTGGTATLDAWSHVVAVWNGSRASLYVNGALANDGSTSGGSGTYNASTAAIFSVGAYDTGAGPYVGRVDEVAFYPSALTPAQILNHFNLASSPVAGAYSTQVLADGAVEYLQQNPPAVRIARSGPDMVVTYTGILSQSADLATWQDLTVTSPYTLPSPRPDRLFFRARR
jgi:hypothetical protein